MLDNEYCKMSSPKTHLTEPGLNIDPILKLIVEHESTQLETILRISKERRINASALTVGVKMDRNVSAICRTCEIFGMRDYITFGDNKLDMRAAVGSHNYLRLI